MRVHVVHPSDDLPRQNGSGFLSEEQLLHQELVEVSVTGQFQQQIDVDLVTEEVVELDEVGVPHETLYFDFAQQLVDRFLILLPRTAEQIEFVYYLQGCHETSSDVPASRHRYFTR